MKISYPLNHTSSSLGITLEDIDTVVATAATQATNVTQQLQQQYHPGLMLLYQGATSSALGALIACSIAGNAFVLAAIYLERTLQTVANYLIASLAVTDLLVSVLVLPVAALYQVLGRWTLGQAVCDAFIALDVLCCTSSILHLCAIALDRYWAITDPVDYVNKRTPRRAALMIAVTWVVGFSISIPPMLGWRRPEDRADPDACNISQHLGYTIYSTFGAFYIPLLLMLVLYGKIFSAARFRIRKNVAFKSVSHTDNGSADGPIAVTARSSEPATLPNHSTVPAEQTSDGPEGLLLPIVIRDREEADGGGGRVGQERTRSHHQHHHHESHSQQRDHEHRDSQQSHGHHRHRHQHHHHHRHRHQHHRRRASQRPGQQQQPQEQHSSDQQQQQSHGQPQQQSHHQHRQHKSQGNHCHAQHHHHHQQQQDQKQQQQDHHHHHHRRHHQQQQQQQHHDHHRHHHQQQPQDHHQCKHQQKTGDHHQKQHRGHHSCHHHQHEQLQLKSADDQQQSADHKQQQNKQSTNNNDDTHPQLHHQQQQQSTENQQQQSTSQQPLQQQEHLKQHADHQQQHHQQKPAADPQHHQLQEQQLEDTQQPADHHKAPHPSQDLQSKQAMDRAQMHRMRSAMARERKAVKTLGIIMGSFVLCWLPFFVVALVVPFCGPLCNLPSILMALITWLGYSNSLLNPVIYAYFNRDFQNAFKKIARCTCCRGRY